MAHQAIVIAYNIFRACIAIVSDGVNILQSNIGTQYLMGRKQEGAVLDQPQSFVSEGRNYYVLIFCMMLIATLTSVLIGSVLIKPDTALIIMVSAVLVALLFVAYDAMVRKRFEIDGIDFRYMVQNRIVMTIPLGTILEIGNYTVRPRDIDRISILYNNKDGEQKRFTISEDMMSSHKKMVLLLLEFAAHSHRYNYAVIDRRAWLTKPHWEMKKQGSGA